jgi:hypothetical protein
MTPVIAVDPETLLINKDAAIAIGREAAESYRARAPYPYGCFDNFLPYHLLPNITEWSAWA